MDVAQAAQRRSDPAPARRAATERQRDGLSVVGLFAGIGGLELGLERAGHRTELLCELMPDARAVLEAARERRTEPAFPHAKFEVDVTSRALENALPGRFDLLAAGFPCQDLSPAGSTAGINGSQSGLIGHVFELLKRRRPAARPTWVVLENVWNMRHLDEGKAMKVVLSALTGLGYSWAYREVDSLAFGLPQRRKRLFIVACLQGAGDPRRVLLEGDVPAFKHVKEPAWLGGKACAFSWTEGNRGVGWAVDSVPTLKVGSGLDIPSPPAIILPPDGRIVVPTIRDVERLQGFPRGWTEPAAEVDPRNGRSRWRLVGNAVSVPVAEWIGRRLAEAHRPLPLPEGTTLDAESKWPPAAWQIPGGPRHAADLGTWPLAAPRTPLLELLDEEPAVRALLSSKAASGFLRRFQASNLFKRAPEHRAALLRVLREHVDRPAPV